ncbi:MAG: hypothetical protein NVSMB49_01320 [Ktedonobacteraceae bacterium]
MHNYNTQLTIVITLLLTMLILLAGCTSQSNGLAASTPTSATGGNTSTAVSGGGIPSSGSGGSTPIAQHTLNEIIENIHMIDATTGWALTDKGVVHTTDGEMHWQDVSQQANFKPAFPQAISSDTLGSAVFLDASTSWVLAGDYGQTQNATPSVAKQLSIYHTTNAGQTWQKQTIQISDSSGCIDAAQLTFLDTRQGWLLCTINASPNTSNQSVDLFHTTDGGEVWNKVDGPFTIGGYPPELRFVNASTGWIAGSDYTHKIYLQMTHDGGMTWQAETIPPPDPELVDEVYSRAPMFFNAQDGILPVAEIRNYETVIYVTHDGGMTWSKTSGVYACAGCGTDFTDMQHGWILDRDSKVLYATSDGGQHWTKQYAAFNMNAPQFNFVSPGIGWAIEVQPNSNRQLLKTTDGGQTWKQVAYTIS